MRHIYQEDNHSCNICAWAMVTDRSREQLFDIVGHDGSEHCDKSPCGHVGIHSEEMTYAVLQIGYAVTPLHTDLVWVDCDWPRPRAAPQWPAIWDVMQGRRAVIDVKSKHFEGGWHAVAWDGTHVLDPQRHSPYHTDDLNDDIVSTVWLAHQIR